MNLYQGDNIVNRAALTLGVLAVLAGFGITAQTRSDIPTVFRYPGDLNSDGMVNIGDLCSLTDHWLQPTADPNLDIAPAGGDGKINLADFSLLASDWSKNSSLPAALAGIEYAQDLAATTQTFGTGSNFISDEEADLVWSNLCANLQAQRPGGQEVPDAVRFTDAYGSGDHMITPPVPCGAGDVSFTLRFYRYDINTRMIRIDSAGFNGPAGRTLTAKMKIKKWGSISNYAVAGRGRIGLAGNTTVHGDIYSAWDIENISPFHMTEDPNVEGSFHTVLAWQDLLDESTRMQTFVYDTFGNLMLNDNQSFNLFGHLINADGQVIRNSSGSRLIILSKNFENVENQHHVPIDDFGNPIQGYINYQPIGPIMYGNPVEVFDAFGNRIYDPSDELQGTYETVHYSRPGPEDMPGLKISDYDTSAYKSAIPSTTVSAAGSVIQNGVLSTSGVTTRTEYFPHAAGSYTTRASSSSLSLTRYVYENKTIRNVRINGGTNALFKNCIFEDVLYVDCSATGPTSTVSTYNNIRFENCTFNGILVTNTPQALNSGWWMRNALYFTGQATFTNISGYPEATILAPHFNIEIGKLDPDADDINEINGSIVGGIVDVRGNAQIHGTIISMADTTVYSVGYITEIGVTPDGGSGYVGSIEITPSSVSTPTPLSIVFLQDSLREL
jgi:hypothetical protein